jgi:hypothetical protein
VILLRLLTCYRPLRLQHWQRVRRLSFHSNSYPDGCSDFLDMSKASHLQHLRLTFK